MTQAGAIHFHRLHRLANRAIQQVADICSRCGELDCSLSLCEERLTATRSVVMTLAVAFKPRLSIANHSPSRQRRLKSSPEVSFVVFNTILDQKLQVLF